MQTAQSDMGISMHKKPMEAFPMAARNPTKEVKTMLSLSDKIVPCKGEFHVRVLRGGEVIDRIDDHNLVVDAGRIRLAELAAGKSGAYITHIGLGSGAVAEDVSDTTLADQQLFPLTGATVNGRDVQFDFFIDTWEANGLAIHEFGLFCSDGQMFSHRVRKGVIEKQNDIQIQGYWILHF